ncbi:hypothetical protein WP50_11985 [Lactiplantibacillus plantarum]|nr:hypothetical protein WP50_11985 [Lactiplantibacillus plantarum]
MSCNIVTRVRQPDGRFKFVLNRVANYYHSGTETGQTKAMSTYATELRRFILWCVNTYQLHYSMVLVDPASLALRQELMKVGIEAGKADNNIVTRVRQPDGRFKFVLNRVANYYHSGTETGQTKAMSTYATELRRFILWCVNTYQLHYSMVLVDPASLALRQELMKVGIEAGKADNNGHDHVGNSKGIEVGIQRQQSLI